MPVTELDAAWPEGAQCVYIGKADVGSRGKRHLRRRIKEFRQYGDGLPVGHQGGRRIWQLADAGEFIIAWLLTSRDPEEVEGEPYGPSSSSMAGGRSATGRAVDGGEDTLGPGGSGAYS